MALLDEELRRWGQELQKVHLPRWEELPDFNIYMDQLISLVHDYLSFSQIRPEEKLLTTAMINNYVKLKILPKPERKKYTRLHMAFIIIIVLLKPVLSIGEIKSGILLQVRAFKGDYCAAYNLFCKQYERTLHYSARMANRDFSNEIIMEKLPIKMMGTSMVTQAVACKLFAQKVLVILETAQLNSAGEIKIEI